MFFTFTQNISGGYFVVNENTGVAEYVIIEADSAQDALARHTDIGNKTGGFWSFCPCCGERWYDVYSLEDEDGTKTPSIYGRPLEEVSATGYRSQAFIHYKDGKIVKHQFI